MLRLEGQDLCDDYEADPTAIATEVDQERSIGWLVYPEEPE